MSDATTMELKSDREIVIARVFRAPAKLVFEAWTNADLVRQWWAPRSRGVEMVECTADVRIGGKYRYVLRHGQDSFAFSGSYTEIHPSSRLVYTQIFEAFPGPPVIITVTFEDRPDGKTQLVSHELYPDAQTREAALASGMESGMRETMNQLDDMVASLVAARPAPRAT